RGAKVSSPVRKVGGGGCNMLLACRVQAVGLLAARLVRSRHIEQRHPIFFRDPRWNGFQRGLRNGRGRFYCVWRAANQSQQAQ
ncbi:MAG: hypothetical protein ACPGWR_13745, partial [Ardenticatenaceae bacterium]